MYLYINIYHKVEILVILKNKYVMHENAFSI